MALADDALPVADQVIDQVEHLWCDRDHLGASTQLATVRVKRIVLEEIAHSHSRRWPSDP
jgi:hypothetical protein